MPCRALFERGRKLIPRTDVYHKGQGARCVYIGGFRTDVFRIENSAVGNNFNQITLYPLSSSSPLQSIANNSFLSYKIQNNCCLSLLGVCHFLPQGEDSLSTSFSYSFQRRAPKCCLICISCLVSASGPSNRRAQFVVLE